jgi:hypothetical protein
MRGVKVGLVEASQAVFVKIGEGDKVVPTLDRNAAMIEKRALFLRVHVVTESGWMARPLRAALTLAVAGEEQTLEDTRMIAGSSDTRSWRAASTSWCRRPGEAHDRDQRRALRGRLLRGQAARGPAPLPSRGRRRSGHQGPAAW